MVNWNTANLLFPSYRSDNLVWSIEQETQKNCNPSGNKNTNASQSWKWRKENLTRRHTSGKSSDTIDVSASFGNVMVSALVQSKSSFFFCNSGPDWADRSQINFSWKKEKPRRSDYHPFSKTSGYKKTLSTSQHPFAESWIAENDWCSDWTADGQANWLLVWLRDLRGALDPFSARSVNSTNWQFKRSARGGYVVHFLL